MKKVILSLSTLCLLAGAAKAQYSQTFSTGTLTTVNNSVGDVPAGMTQIKGNPLGYNAQITGAGSIFAAPNDTKGFVIVKLNNGDTVAYATSYYTTPARSDNWLITPVITGITAGTFLIFNDASQDPSYPDSVAVMVSTSSSPNPQPADFTQMVLPLSQAGDGAGGWGLKAADLTQFAGQSIRLGFHHQAFDGFFFLLDDIRTEVVSTQRDIAVQNVFIPKYTNSSIPLKVDVQSFGAAPVTSFRLNYQVGTATPVSQVFNTPLSYLGKASVSFSTPAAITASANVKVWVDQVNNASDEVATNDSKEGMTYFIASSPARKVVIEEFTGAWCQYCPDGQTVVNQIVSSNPNAIGIAIHNQDQMVNTDAQVIDNTYSVGYPSGLINRTLFAGQSDVATNRGDWPTLVTQNQNAPVPAKVSFVSKTWDAATRQLSVTIKADFIADVAGDFRIGAMITEDDVYNSDNVTGWSQVNAYNTVSTSEWYNKGNPIVGFKHKHVLETMLGGTWGDAGVIPASVTNGQSFTKTYTWTVPAQSNGPIHRWNADNMYIVAYVSEYDADPAKRPILNAEEARLTWALSVENTVNPVTSVAVYPNPAKDVAHVAFELSKGQKVNVEVVDASGRVVAVAANAAMQAGAHNVEVSTANLASGVYMVKIQTEGGSRIERLSVIK